MRTISVKLGELRENCGMTVNELSLKAGCSASLIKSLENGSCDMIRLKLGTAAAIANALDMTIDEVFTSETVQTERTVYRIFTTGFVKVPAAGRSFPECGVTEKFEGDILCADDKCHDSLASAKEALAEMRSVILGPYTLRDKNKRIFEVKEYFIESITVDSFGRESFGGERIYAAFE